MSTAARRVNVVTASRHYPYCHRHHRTPLVEESAARLRNDFVEIDQLNPQGGSHFLFESSCNSCIGMSMVTLLLSGAFAVAEGSTICPQIVRLVEHFATCAEPTLQHPVKLVLAPDCANWAFADRWWRGRAHEQLGCM